MPKAGVKASASSTAAIDTCPLFLEPSCEKRLACEPVEKNELQ